MKFLKPCIIGMLVSMQLFAQDSPFKPQARVSGSVKKAEPQSELPFYQRLFPIDKIKDAAGSFSDTIKDTAMGSSAAYQSVWLVDPEVEWYKPETEAMVKAGKIRSIELRYYPYALEAKNNGDWGQLYFEVIRHNPKCLKEENQDSKECLEYQRIGYKELPAKLPDGSIYKGWGLNVEDYHKTAGGIALSIDKIWEQNLSLRKFGAGVLTVGTMVATLAILNKVSKMIEGTAVEDGMKKVAGPITEAAKAGSAGLEKMLENPENSGLGKKVTIVFFKSLLSTFGKLIGNFADSHLNRRNQMLMMSLMIELPYLGKMNDAWDDQLKYGIVNHNSTWDQTKAVVPWLEHISKGKKDGVYPERQFLGEILDKAESFVKTGKTNQAAFVKGKHFEEYWNGTAPDGAGDEMPKQIEEEFTDAQKKELEAYPNAAPNFLRLGLGNLDIDDLDIAWDAFEKMNRLERSGGYLKLGSLGH